MIKVIALFTMNISEDPSLTDKHERMFSNVCRFLGQSFSGTYYQLLSSLCFGFDNYLNNNPELNEKKIKYRVHYVFDIPYYLKMHLEAERKLQDCLIGYLYMELEDISCLAGIKAVLDIKYNGILKMNYFYFNKRNKKAYCSTNHNFYDNYIMVNYDNDLSFFYNIPKTSYSVLLRTFFSPKYDHKYNHIKKDIKTKLLFLDAAKKENPIKMLQVIKESVGAIDRMVFKVVKENFLWDKTEYQLKVESVQKSKEEIRRFYFEGGDDTNGNV